MPGIIFGSELIIPALDEYAVLIQTYNLSNRSWTSCSFLSAIWKFKQNKLKYKDFGLTIFGDSTLKPSNL